MVVQHNITAMNANRMLGVTTTGQAKSTEKLSSGYKINRAADDAAGLSISEKMRKQIRGLSQASDNAEDGISCVQTAEGALTEVHSMLQRMNELAVKAGNGTMSEDDRQNVQDEIDQLVDEIDRVSETTKFNETYLLKGDDTGAKTYSASYKTPVTNDIGYAANKTAGDLAWYAEGGTTKLTLDELKSDYLEVGTDGKVALKEGKKLYTEAANTTGEYGAQLSDKIAAVTDIQAVLTAKSTALTKQDGTAITEAGLADYFDADGTYKGGLYKAATADGAATEVGAEQIANYVKVTASNASDLLLSFQVGADMRGGQRRVPRRHGRPAAEQARAGGGGRCHPPSGGRRPGVGGLRPWRGADHAPVREKIKRGASEGLLPSLHLTCLRRHSR